MTTRLLLGYGLVALILAAGMAALWFSVIRERLAHRRRRARGERERIARQSDIARPAYEAD